MSGMPPLSNTTAHMRVCTHTVHNVCVHIQAQRTATVWTRKVNTECAAYHNNHRLQKSVALYLDLYCYFLNFRIFNKKNLKLPPFKLQRWCARAGIWPAFTPRKLQINVDTRYSCHADINPTQGLRGSMLYVLTWQHIQVVKETLPALCGTAFKTSDRQSWNDDINGKFTCY